jgi:hypothetical protein
MFVSPIADKIESETGIDFGSDWRLIVPIKIIVSTLVGIFAYHWIEVRLAEFFPRDPFKRIMLWCLGPMLARNNDRASLKAGPFSQSAEKPLPVKSRIYCLDSRSIARILKASILSGKVEVWALFLCQKC